MNVKDFMNVYYVLKGKNIWLPPPPKVSNSILAI